MYGAIDSNDQYELKMIQTQCWLCGLSIEVWREYMLTVQLVYKITLKS